MGKGYSKPNIITGKSPSKPVIKNDMTVEEAKQQMKNAGVVFNDILINKYTNANNQINQVQDIFGRLTNNTLGEIRDLTTKVNDENNLVDSQTKYNQSLQNESGIVKFQYGKKELDILKYQNTILFFIFYVLVIILGVIMFYYNNVNLIIQTFVFHVLLVYPFIIYYLELSCFIIWKYTYSYLFSIPYESIYVGFG